MTINRFIAVCLTVAGAALGATSPGATASAATTSTTETFRFPFRPDFNVRVTEYTVDNGDPLASFRFKRLTPIARLGHPQRPVRGAVVLLPPLGNDDGFYLSGTFPTRFFRLSYPTSIAGALVSKGVEVWLYSGRGADIAQGECAADPTGCAVLGSFGLQTIIDDTAVIRAEVSSVAPGRSVVVGGFSAGAIAAKAVIDADPGGYDGLIVWEGSLSASDPVDVAYAAGLCAQLDGLIDAGITYDDQGGPYFRQLASLARLVPNLPIAEVPPPPGPPAPPPPPGIDTVRQLFVLSLVTPAPSINIPRPQVPPNVYTLAAGDPWTGNGTLFNADDRRLFNSIRDGFIDTVALRLPRDFYCALGGDDSFENNLGAFAGHVLRIESGLGFGPLMTTVPAQLSGAASHTVISDPSFGHVDWAVSDQRATVLDQPIDAWLSANLF